MSDSANFKVITCTFSSHIPGVARLFCVASFLFLSACGGGSDSGNLPMQVSKPVTPAASIIVDLTQAKLLNDAELQTSVFSNLATPNAEEKVWLQNNHKKIRSLTYDKDFSDLTFLDSLLNGKRIVQLGESSHGTREFSQMKVRMIKYLHEKLGYDVIAFESSITGCYLQDLEYAKGKTFNLKDSCIFGIWGSKEVQELFDYLAYTRKTEHPLRLAGFDIQISGSFDRSDVVMPWLMPILRATGDENLVKAESTIMEALRVAEAGAGCYNSPATVACQDFHNNYLTVALKIGQVASNFKIYADASAVSEREIKKMAWLALFNLQIRLTDTKSQLDKPSFYEPRDKAMAANVTQLATEIFPTEKIIVWAHNVHITPADSGVANSGRSMGNFLTATWQQQLFTIGLFMLRGETANNFGNSLYVQAPISGSLESYAASMQLGAVFIPIPKTDQTGIGDDWLHKIIPYYYWGGLRTIKSQLDASYDAVIVVDHSSMPQYLW